MTHLTSVIIGQTWPEIERAIASLPEERERGDAFEVFVEALIRLDPRRQIQTYWRPAFPPSIRDRLGLGPKDEGVDAIFEDTYGQLTAVQAKFRQDRRAALSWSELATFFGCTERADHRLIVANVTHLPRLIAKRQHFSAILVDELDTLPASFFTSLKEYLATRHVVYPAAKQPYPFQQEIINRAIQHFQQNGRSRGQLIMACGAGKTLTALWIAEGLGAREVLVLVPSLALMRQTLREWATNTAAPPLDCICICSDVTVARSSDGDPDPALQGLWEMGVPVSTEPTDLFQFLNQPRREKMRVVISTYQSADVLETSLSQLPGFRFDLAVCDEAHRTAGPQDRPFAKALDDDVIPSSRRLFMTATPRLVAPHLQRRAASEDIVLCSMDDEAKYGPVIYRLTFGEAIRLNIISDYRIILVGVRDPEIRQLLEENPPLGTTGPEERAVRARHLAKQLAVLKGMAECDARKVFTFHGRIKAAKAFALASTPEGIQHVLHRLPAYRDRLTGFRADHVNGTQSTADRAAILQEALGSLYGLVSNAGCLTEGVDIPAVDAVAFIDPRESLSAIVQATGRALRKAEGKPCGYILIPVFLEETDDPDQIAESSQFKTVYRVVRAMADQDERLEEQLRLARHEMALGTSGVTDSGPIVTVGIKTSYADFDRTIYLRIVERTAPNWEYMFALLEAFKAENGHVSVHPEAVYRDNPLGSWLNTQRQFKKKGKLSDERIRRLEALGVRWEPREEKWEEMFALVKAYSDEHGHVGIPAGEVIRGKRLGVWLIKQRELRKRGKLIPERIQRLEALGVDWDSKEARWNEMADFLGAYKSEHGHVRPLQSERFRDAPVGKWLVHQRQMKKLSKLSPERSQRLEALGVDWDSKDAQWNEMYRLLDAYKAEHGHVRPSQDEMYRGNALGRWLDTQRQLKKRGKLRAERVHELESLGVEWEPIDAQWEEMFSLLEVYKVENWHVQVPQDAIFRDKPLGSWLSTQRQLKKKGSLNPDRSQRLEGLGVEWEPFEKQWEQMYALLRDYRQEHGHVSVPEAEVFGGKRLGRWVLKHRQFKKQGKLSPERIQRLEALGVDWEPVEVQWEEMFALLSAYRNECGHVDVPQGAVFGERRLGAWLNRQRQLKKRGRLAPDREQRLEVLGVEWEPKDAQWEKMYLLLDAYKAEYGHVSVEVTESFRGEPLGSWLTTQRQFKKRGKFSVERIQRLEAIGVQWDPRAAQWEKMQSLLVAYKAERGHLSVKKGETFGGGRLGSWLDNQRQLKKCRKLSTQRIQRLEALGVEWQRHQAQWDKMFGLLIAFRAERGHVQVRQDGIFGGEQLGRWLHKQRQLKKRGKLSPDRVQRLEAHGVAWELKISARTKPYLELNPERG